MGSQGHSCLSPVVEIVEWSLVLSSSESVLLGCDGEEHGLSVDILIVGDEGSGVVYVLSLGVWLIWYHSGTQGVQATCLRIVLLVVMVLRWD